MFARRRSNLSIRDQKMLENVMAENKELHELVDSLFADNDKIDAIDAQVLYTALMTDTLLEEGE